VFERVGYGTVLRIKAASGLFLMTPLSVQWGADELFWPQAVRGFAGMFIIVPITNLALGDQTWS
jgi:hypothetical protein